MEKPRTSLASIIAALCIGIIVGAFGFTLYSDIYGSVQLVTTPAQQKKPAPEKAPPAASTSKELLITCDYKDTELRVILADLMRQTLENERYRGTLDISQLSEQDLSLQHTLKLTKIPYRLYLDFLCRKGGFELEEKDGRHIFSRPDFLEGPITRSYSVTPEELNKIGLSVNGGKLHLSDGSPWPVNTGEGEAATYSKRRSTLVIRMPEFTYKKTFRLIDSALFITRNSPHSVDISHYLPK